MKNMNEGTDLLINEGLAGMPTADKLWLILIEELESEVGPTDTLATLTQAVATEIGVTSRVCALRSIDMGGPHLFPETSGTVGAVAVLTDDPDTAGAKVIGVEAANTSDPETAFDLSVSGPYTVSSLSVKVAFQDEA